MMNQFAIELNGVSKSFAANGKVEQVLNQVTGNVRVGSILTVIGPSGSGKSTILSMCNLLLTPDEGEVFIHGKEVRTWEITELRKKVGIAFQAAPMIPGTVLDNLVLPATIHKSELERPEGFLEKVRLPKTMLQKNVQDLSGGQKQRVALARTLVNKPTILLLDEVSSALDPSSVREIEELIVNIQKEEQTTIIWVTHDLEQAQRVGTHCWFVSGGELVEQGPTELFFSSPKEEMTREFLAKGMKS
ncbi:phosphate ABC transporter ATP-binding protein [Bacillus sp. FJAT-49736]|uniref:ABC transporter ATP-binding protein n=1 Tax=Bacillus sp. FJAT-49736 TaxID=2833582 RepID=UPI001BC9B2AB|nr:phosphate ABC transporter ATP-binding protein [Bacillus sp. FJAT-49736]MBS4173063.1 phosphate ABC transporter ATP-binding protein [Bacillus sp. FJAT-49736]